MGRSKISAKISQNLKQAIIAFYQVPNTVQQTVDHFGISLTALNQILAEGAIPKHDKQTQSKLCSAKKAVKLNAEQVQQAISLYKQGESVRSIAKQFFMSDKKILDIFQAERVNIRSHEEQVTLGREAAKQTNLARYGVESPAAAKEIKEKIKQTNLERYGRTNVGQFGTEEHNYAIKEKYGVTNIAQSPIVQEKIAATSLERYGGVGFASKALSEKVKDVCIENWGVAHFAQSVLAASQRRSIFIFEDVHFDSLPELAFYLYHVKNNIAVKRCPAKIEYTYEGSSHFYFPDFEVANQLIEIKGNHLVKSDGTWYCPFDSTKDGLFEARHQCALANNVQILYQKDYQKYLDWFYECGYKKENFQSIK